jgi:hypothetical protein
MYASSMFVLVVCPANAYIRYAAPPRIRALAFGLERLRRTDMAKSQRKSSKEIRKPKKEAPPKANASQASTKGTVLGKSL